MCARTTCCLRFPRPPPLHHSYLDLLFLGPRCAPLLHSSGRGSPWRGAVCGKEALAGLLWEFKGVKLSSPGPLAHLPTLGRDGPLPVSAGLLRLSLRAFQRAPRGDSGMLLSNAPPLPHGHQSPCRPVAVGGLRSLTCSLGFVGIA